MSTWLIVGLGNPGGKYEKNRHNIGFMAAEAFKADNPSLSVWKSKHSGLMSDGTLGGHKVYLLQPQTYMNDSGRSVSAAARFFKIPASQVIVFYDELDLAPGRIRIKQGGGHGGHNGLKSIDAHLGKDYWRVRLGIGHPGPKERVIGHVLGDFAKADQEWLQRLLETCSRHLPILLDGKFETYQSKVAQDAPAPKTALPKSEA